MRRRALFFVNRRSRSGAAFAERARRLLRARGFELEDMREPWPALRRAPRGARAADLAVIGGGDGTLNHAVDMLARLRLPVGILPLGTANDFARSVGIPRSLEAACDVIAAGRTRAIDLGTVNGRFFLNDVSLGLSTRVAAGLTASAKRRFGVFAAAGIALRALTRARRFRVSIRAGRERIAGLAYQLTVGNGIFLGGIVKNADASLDDGRLDMYLLQTRRPEHVAAMIPYAASGRYDANPYVMTRKGRRFSIRTTRPMRLYTDGEPAGRTPATVAVAPKALTVFASR